MKIRTFGRTRKLPTRTARNYLGKTMSFEPDQEIERFVCRFLETHGAVLEENSKNSRRSCLKVCPDCLRLPNIFTSTGVLSQTHRTLILSPGIHIPSITARTSSRKWLMLHVFRFPCLPACQISKNIMPA